MKKVAHIIQRKGSSVISIKPGTTVFDALEIMSEKNIGSIIVMNEDGYLGLLTERDYARKVILLGKSSSETPVEEIMSVDLPNITPDSTIEECMHIMSENNLRYLPVFNNNKELSGIISINDIIKEVILAQKETIDYLDNYIRS